MHQSNITDSSTYFEIVDTRNIRPEMMDSIADIERDMWARNEGLGEYMICEGCDTIYSKQDLYPGLSKDTYKRTIGELEVGGFLESRCCQHCSGNLAYCFPKDELMRELQERYSSQALLITMNQGDGLIGFMDGYIDDFSTIYRREFKDHYGYLGQDVIADAIANILDADVPDEMFSCCSLGTRESYMNFFNIYNLLQFFFANFPESKEDCLGISEINKGGTLDKLYAPLGSKQLILPDNGEGVSTSDVYNSGIFIQEELGKTYREGFRCGAKEFLQKNRVRRK